MDTNGSSPAPRRRRTARVKADITAAPPAGVAAASAGTPATPGATPTTRPDGTDASDLADAAELAADLAAEGLVRTGVSIPEATLASLELSRGAIGRLDAENVSVTMGAVGLARADTLEVQLGTVGAAMTNELSVTQGALGTVLAGTARLDGAVVRSLIARHVVVERPSIVGFLVARRVSGDVRVLFDWRGALVFGAIFGVIARVGRRRR